MDDHYFDTVIVIVLDNYWIIRMFELDLNQYLCFDDRYYLLIV